MTLKPFFCYYGGKWRVALKYPAPLHDIIVEPFAGAAGYATRYYERKIKLIDNDPLIVALWRYLVRASVFEIMSLPLRIEHVDDIAVAEEAKWLIGFWLNKGTAQPCKQPGAWMREGLRPKSFWGEEIRARIAAQVEHIRHWQIYYGSYADCPNGVATWFIDPPYADQGKHYKSGVIADYEHLGAWCRTREGQVIVCENSGAKWLPFQKHITIKGTEGAARKKRSEEVIWVSA